MSAERVRLGDAADLLAGFAFKSAQFLQPDEPGIKLVRGDNVQQGYLRWGDKAMRWKADAFEDLARYQLKLDDVVLAMDRPIVGGGLKLAWVKDADLPSLLVQRVTRIRGLPGVANTTYLRYALSAPDFVAHIDRVTTGANIPHISGKDIAAFELRLPPLDQQLEMVEKLTAYDDLIENNRRRIALLEESARLLYREWFVHLRFPGAGLHSATTGLPDGWRIVSLGDLISLKYGKSLKDSDRIPGDVPVFGSSGIVGSNNKALVNGPAIIVGRKGNVGSVYFSQEDCFPIDTVYFVDGPQATFFNLMLLMSQSFVSSDTAVPGLNRTYAHALPVVQPSDDVLNRFEGIVSGLYQQIGVLVKQNSLLNEARDALLPKLMSGEIAV